MSSPEFKSNTEKYTVCPSGLDNIQPNSNDICLLIKQETTEKIIESELENELYGKDEDEVLAAWIEHITDKPNTCKKSEKIIHPIMGSFQKEGTWTSYAPLLLNMHNDSNALTFKNIKSHLNYKDKEELYKSDGLVLHQGRMYYVNYCQSEINEIEPSNTNPDDFNALKHGLARLAVNESKLASLDEYNKIINLNVHEPKRKKAGSAEQIISNLEKNKKTQLIESKKQYEKEHQEKHLGFNKDQPLCTIQLDINFGSSIYTHELELALLNHFQQDALVDINGRQEIGKPWIKKRNPLTIPLIVKKNDKTRSWLGELHYECKSELRSLVKKEHLDNDSLKNCQYILTKDGLYYFNAFTKKNETCTLDKKTISDLHDYFKLEKKQLEQADLDFITKHTCHTQHYTEAKKDNELSIQTALKKALTLLNDQKNKMDEVFLSILTQERGLSGHHYSLSILKNPEHDNQYTVRYYNSLQNLEESNGIGQVPSLQHLFPEHTQLEEKYYLPTRQFGLNGCGVATFTTIAKGLNGVDLTTERHNPSGTEEYLVKTLMFRHIEEEKNKGIEQNKPDYTSIKLDWANLKTNEKPLAFPRNFANENYLEIYRVFEEKYGIDMEKYLSNQHSDEYEASPIQSGLFIIPPNDNIPYDQIILFFNNNPGYVFHQEQLQLYYIDYQKQKLEPINPLSGKKHPDLLSEKKESEVHQLTEEERLIITSSYDKGQGILTNQSPHHTIDQEIDENTSYYSMNPNNTINNESTIEYLDGMIPQDIDNDTLYYSIVLNKTISETHQNLIDNAWNELNTLVIAQIHYLKKYINEPDEHPGKNKYNVMCALQNTLNPGIIQSLTVEDRFKNILSFEKEVADKKSILEKIHSFSLKTVAKIFASLLIIPLFFIWGSTTTKNFTQPLTDWMTHNSNCANFKAYKLNYSNLTNENEKLQEIDNSMKKTSEDTHSLRLLF